MVMVVTKGSLIIGVASIEVVPWRLPHLWEPIGWLNFQGDLLNLDMSYVLSIRGDVFTSTPKGLWCPWDYHRDHRWWGGSTTMYG